MTKCTAITRGGSRCKGIAVDSSGYCHAHHPDRAEQRKRAASRGGRRGGRGRPQSELALLKSEVREVIEAVRKGKLDKGIGAVVFQGYGVVLKAHEVELRRAEIVTQDDLKGTMGVVVEVVQRHLPERERMAAFHADLDEMLRSASG